jgi:O-antigen/teichoic acid export membrane protein
VWGEFVKYLLVFNLGAQLIGWGSKQYLIREFAADSSNAGSCWFTNLKARFPLLVFFIIPVLLLNIEPGIKTALILWQLAAFFSRSFEPLIIYFKKIKFFLALELTLSLLFLALIFINRQKIDALFLLNVFVIIEILRMIASGIYFKSSLQFKFTFSIEVKALSAGSIFFILGTLGMLQSRLDLYFAALLLSKNEIAVYQVLINFILLAQAATGFIIQPFLKEIYRMNQRTLTRFSNKFTLYGILFTIPMMAVINFVLSKFYKIELSREMFILSYFYIIPIFYYTIRVYLLYKIKKESLILFAGITVLVLSVPVNYYLITMFRINGALTAGVIGEMLSLLFYFMIEKKIGLVDRRLTLISGIN